MHDKTSIPLGGSLPNYIFMFLLALPAHPSSVQSDLVIGSTRKNGACGKGANHRGRLEMERGGKKNSRKRIYTYVQRVRRGMERKESLKSKIDDSRRECESLLFAHQ